MWLKIRNLVQFIIKRVPFSKEEPRDYYKNTSNEVKIELKVYSKKF